MQPLHDDLRDPAAQDNSITHAAAAPSNLDAATTMRSADTALRNTIELRSGTGFQRATSADSATFWQLVSTTAIRAAPMDWIHIGVSMTCRNYQ